MKIDKLKFSYSCKKSKNYNSIEATEGFEAQIESVIDLNAFEELKKACKDRVNNFVDTELNNLPDKKDWTKPIVNVLPQKQSDDLADL